MEVVLLDDLQKYVSAQSYNPGTLPLEYTVQLLQGTLNHSDFPSDANIPQLNVISRSKIDTVRTLIGLVRDSAKRSIIVATCREQDERAVRVELSELFDELEVIALHPFSPDPEDTEAKSIIQAFKEREAEYTGDWDGTLGSLVLGLSR